MAYHLQPAEFSFDTNDDSSNTLSYRDSPLPLSDASDITESDHASPLSETLFTLPPTTIELKPVTMHQTPPQTNSRTRMTSGDIPTFRGDGLYDDPKPQSWFNQCRAKLMDTDWSDSKTMEWFQLKLEPGTDADTWYTNLDVAFKGSMSLIKTQFDIAFPADPNPSKSITDKWARLISYVLTESKMMEVDAEGKFGYASWATQMQKYATGITDTGGVLVDQVHATCLPSVLQDLTPKGVSFLELANNIRAVERSKLVKAFSKEQRTRAIETELEATKHRVAPGMSTRDVTAAFGNMGLSRTNTQPPPFFNTLRTTQQTAQANQGIPARRATGIAPVANGLAQHSAADIALRSRDLPTRLADLTRTALPRATTTAEYNTQVTAYFTAHGNVLPTEQRPFPLTPGTANIGSRECHSCGRIHDRPPGVICTAERLPYKERNFRMTCSVIHGIVRGAGGMGGTQTRQQPSAATQNANIFFMAAQLLQHAQQTGLLSNTGGYQGGFIEDEDQGKEDGVPM